MAADLEGRRAALALAEGAAGIGVWDVDLRTQTLRGTDQFFRLMGLGPAPDGVPMAVTRGLRSPEDQGRLTEEYQRALTSGGDLCEAEYRIRRADGETRWIFGRGRIIRDAAGNPVRYSGIDIDVTEKKNAEAALRESEQRFRYVFEQSPLGKAMAGPDLRLRAVNPALCGMLGYAAEELVGRCLTDLVHPDDLDACLLASRALVGGGVPKVELEERLVRKGGEPLWARVVMGPVRDAEGRLVHTLAILQDIDGSRRVLQALRDSEENLRRLNDTLERQAGERARQLASSRAQLQAFFDNSPDWLTLQRATPDGRFVYVDINPTCEAAYGLRRDQVVGRTVEEVLGAEGGATPVRHFRECLRTGEPQRYVTRRTMAGRTRTIDVMVVRVPGAGLEGQPLLITTARDMTEREEIESQLRQAQKMEAIGHLTGGIAHDFNNLLAVIRGGLELSRRRLDGGNVRDLPHLISTAMTATDRAAALVHRLLAFARRQPLDPRPLQVDPLVASMEELLRRTLGPSISLRTCLGGAWTVLCDRNQLENAILNLAINARDAMPDGGSLDVETGNAHLGGTPSDARMGHGMPREVMARIFEPFFTTEPTGKGTGLGLSMLYGFVRQSGGHVRVSSEVGVGTTVSIHLPRHEGREADDMASPPVARAVPPPHLLAREGGTVLLVEDEGSLRTLVSDVLGELGHEMVTASDGPTALRAISLQARLDLLVTDVGLPGGLNGRQVADAARERWPDLKVLFITGFSYASALGTGAALDPGMEIMIKPFALDAFAARVREMMSGA